MVSIIQMSLGRVLTGRGTGNAKVLQQGHPSLVCSRSKEASVPGKEELEACGSHIYF